MYDTECDPACILHIFNAVQMVVLSCCSDSVTVTVLREYVAVTKKCKLYLVQVLLCVSPCSCHYRPWHWPRQASSWWQCVTMACTPSTATAAGAIHFFDGGGGWIRFRGWGWLGLASVLCARVEGPRQHPCTEAHATWALRSTHVYTHSGLSVSIVCFP